MLAISAEFLTVTYKEALQLQNEGKDELALKKYSELVRAKPNIAEVHFQIARIYLRNDRPERGLQHIKAAAYLRPNVGDIWVVWADYVKTLSDKAEKAEFLTAIKKTALDKRMKSKLSTSVAFTVEPRIAPGDVPRAAIVAVTAALDGKQYFEAENLAKAQLAMRPNNPVMNDLMASALLGQGLANAAAPFAEKVLKTSPDFPRARVTYARVLKALHRSPEGVAQCNAVLRMSPGYADAVFARAECYLDMRHRDMAIADLRRVLDLDPGFDRAYLKLANLLREDFDLFEALAIVRKAEKRGIRATALHLQKAAILADLDRPEEALEVFEKLIERNPKDAVLQTRVAELRQTLGDFEGADRAFERALDLDPTRGETYRVQLTSKKVDLDDPRVAVMEGHFADETLSPDRRANFGFALAKVMEDNKKYDRVFTYLRPANEFIRKADPYDMARRIDHEHRVMDSLRTLDWASAPVNEASDFAPIFVTGMPRSGTTLVEQIIASHSQVSGGGEISILPKRTLKAFGDDGGNIIPANQVPAERFADIAEWYQAYLGQLFPDAKRITDKSIQTYSMIGPVRVAMPKSRIVVVRRDPRDNLLSIYKNIFPEDAHLYAYSQTQIVQMYHLFVEYMDLWREMAPDWFYEIQYEDLVANPEEEARKLIAACDLDWEDACLDFHKSDRRVKTLSVYQVRQPIYKSSARSWERYKDDLGELFDALGPDYRDAAE